MEKSNVIELKGRAESTDPLAELLLTCPHQRVQVVS